MEYYPQYFCLGERRIQNVGSNLGEGNVLEKQERASFIFRINVCFTLSLYPCVCCVRGQVQVLQGGKHFDFLDFCLGRRV